MTYDVAVVGGGIMGLSAAYALLRHGVRRVVVLERYRVAHDRAASTDTTKAIRYEYADAEIYSRMVGRSIEMWRDLEAATGAELYNNCGVVCWGRPDEQHVRQSYQTLSKMGLPIREVGPDELVRLYPQFARADITYATVNPEGGFLRASTCVRATEEMVLRLGGEIRDAAHVVGLDAHGDGVTVSLHNGDRVDANKVVLATGAWGAKLLPQLGLTLPLTANKQQVVYISGLGNEFAPGPFPVFLNLNHDFYGFPLDGAGLLKASIHYPGPVIDPDVVQTPSETFIDELVSYLEKYIPDTMGGDISFSRMCMYAMTPDEDFILDYLPGSRDVVVAAGFSGHGFKFGPVIGGLLAALALGEEPEFDMQRFAISRFSL
ncbi:MAG: N-methyl-L-tryptophan oxidase [Chloroflexota bacterium]